MLTHHTLNVDQIISSVSDNAAGATAVFIGTTRNSFKGGYLVKAWEFIQISIVVSGKVVIRLEYQAYSKLAIKTMADIIRTAHWRISRLDQLTSQTVSSLIRCAVHHRLGTVPVGEPSIVIAVSSPHRKEAFSACELILEEVKMKAQIWKREYYEGDNEEEAEWKANG